MKKTIVVIIVCSLILAILVVTGCASEYAAKSSNYEPTWESLAKHEVPEWFRDAKFGIYTHWGPVTVGSEDGPGGGQWYGRNMYMSNSPTFKYHIERFGSQNKVGYKDIVPMFKAEKFDAEQWAKLFAASGAKFAGPVAIHHDNFAMWDSAYTDWDSMDKGPNRDITAELEKAIRKRGMKFIATFHHGFTWRYFEPSYKYDGTDPKYAGLYCQAHEPDAPPTREFMDKWLGMVNEVVEKYKPDLTWFDFGLGDKKRNCITPEYQQQMFADYYNWAARNKRQVGVAHKHKHIHEHTGILDFERGREDSLVPYPWLTDTSVGQWFNQKSAAYKSVDQLVDVLVDIVSKNGCMLLNVGPAADGTIGPQAQGILLGIGDWLKVNGQAIYKTRPWQVFGEGPTRNTGGGFSENKDKPYTSEDIRFTSSKDGKTIYAIVLGWPDTGETVTIRSLADEPGAVKTTDVNLLGHRGRLNWKRDREGLKIDMPSIKPCEHAFALKITTVK